MLRKHRSLTLRARSATLDFADMVNSKWSSKKATDSLIIKAVSGDSNDTRLLESAYHGSVHDVETLVRKGANIHAISTQNKWSTLHLAAVGSHVSAIEVLLKFGAPVNAQDDQGFTAMHICCVRGHVQALAVLIAHTSNADLQLLDHKGHTPLMTAIANNQLECFNCLIQTQPNLAQCRNRQLETALHIACEFGVVAAVSTLLDIGANVDQPTATVDTPLHIASMHGHVDCVAALLAKGATVHVRNNRNVTPLQLAEMSHEQAIVQLLQLSSGGAPVTTSTPVDYDRNILRTYAGKPLPKIPIPTAGDRLGDNDDADDDAVPEPTSPIAQALGDSLSMLDGDDADDDDVDLDDEGVVQDQHTVQPIQQQPVFVPNTRDVGQPQPPQPRSLHMQSHKQHTKSAEAPTLDRRTNVTTSNRPRASTLTPQTSAACGFAVELNGILAHSPTKVHNQSQQPEQSANEQQQQQQQQDKHTLRSKKRLSMPVSKSWSDFSTKFKRDGSTDNITTKDKKAEKKAKSVDTKERKEKKHKKHKKDKKEKKEKSAEKKQKKEKRTGRFYRTLSRSRINRSRSNPGASVSSLNCTEALTAPPLPPRPDWHADLTRTRSTTAPPAYAREQYDDEHPPPVPPRDDLPNWQLEQLGYVSNPIGTPIETQESQNTTQQPDVPALPSRTRAPSVVRTRAPSVTQMTPSEVRAAIQAALVQSPRPTSDTTTDKNTSSNEFVEVLRKANTNSQHSPQPKHRSTRDHNLQPSSPKPSRAPPQVPSPSAARRANAVPRRATRV